MTSIVKRLALFAIAPSSAVFVALQASVPVAFQRENLNPSPGNTLASERLERRSYRKMRRSIPLGLFSGTGERARTRSR